MKSTEFLTETLSRIVYHYTRLPAAAKIMQTGDFQLSSDLGSIEQQYSPKGYRYFLSTTRTKTGGYHNSIGSDAVLFVLDGNWFNQHYISKPIDYWLNRDPTQSHHKRSADKAKAYWFQLLSSKARQTHQKQGRKKLW